VRCRGRRQRTVLPQQHTAGASRSSRLRRIRGLHAKCLAGLVDEGRTSPQARGPVRTPCAMDVEVSNLHHSRPAGVPLHLASVDLEARCLDRLHHRQSVNRKVASTAGLGKRRGGPLAATGVALGVSCDRVCAPRSCGAGLVSQPGGSCSGGTCRCYASISILRARAAGGGGAENRGFSR